MKKIIIFLCACLALTGCHTSSSQKKIGIIVPIEHKAMDEIVGGFEDTLRAMSPNTDLKFKVANAQGDLNLKRAIIQQMKDEGYDVVAPIGTDATQMTEAMIQHQPVISVAGSMTEQDRAKLKTCNITVVHDEIPAQKILQFIHQVYPDMKQLVLVHSASDKVFPEVEQAVAAGKGLGIAVKPVLVPSLNELYSTASNLPANAQGIFVLKDSLIVSGISTLAATAQSRHIPLITSDQGSVQDSAAMALGVHERDIGVEAGKLAAAILAGKSPCSLPMVEMQKLTVFVNPDALAKEQQSLAAIQSAAKARHYTVETVNNM